MKHGSTLALLSGAAWLALCAALPWVPPVDRPGYLQAFFTSVAVPVLLGPALLAVADRTRRHAAAPAWVVAAGGGLGMLPWATSTIVGAWMGDLCAWRPGLVQALLGPAASGAVLGAAAALACCVATTPARRHGVLGGMLALGIIPSLVSMYLEPQAFSLNAFYGYFRGPLYDEGVPGLERPLALRAENAWLVLGLLGLVHAVETARRNRGGAGAAAVGTALLFAAWGGTRTLLEDVVRPGRAVVLAELSATHVTQRALIHAAPGRTPPAMMARVGWEVDRHVDELRALLGLPEGPVVHVFLYPSAEDKFRLIGASGTLLARPWQHEIHVQGTALPVGALRHELAHVVLGEVSGGPFRVPAFLGVLPDLLLVEGAATALEETSGELTPSQRAALMKRMGRLPDLLALRTPWGFWAESGARAYGAAGAFLRLVVEREGGAMLARIYREGDLSAGGDGVARVTAWSAALDAEEVPEQATGNARRALARGGILERRCVDEAAQAWTDGHAAASRGALDDAEALFRRHVELDGTDSALLALLDVAAARGDVDRMARVAGDLLGGEPAPDTRARVLVAWGEGAARAGELDDALVRLREAEPLVQVPARRRGLYVTRRALEVLRDHPRGACAEGAVAVLAFLLGNGPERARGRSDLLALERGASAVPHGPSACGGSGPELRALLAYLMGRQLVADDPRRAELALGEALELGLQGPGIVREAWRLRGEARESAGDFGAASSHYARMAALDTQGAERLESAQALARTAWAKARAAEP